jgi:hypothetical protein
VPLGTLLDSHDRTRTIQRLRGLRPDAAALWGRFTAPHMICHVADQMRVALGDIPARPIHTFVTRTLVKTLVVNTGLQPPRGRIETAPEMLSTKPTTWDADLAAAVDLAERVGRGSMSAVHPAFGPLSTEEWGRLCWKHLDYHLRQFGA